MTTFIELIRDYRLRTERRKAMEDLAKICSMTGVSIPFNGYSCNIDETIMDSPTYQVLKEILRDN